MLGRNGSYLLHCSLVLDVVVLRVLQTSTHLIPTESLCRWCYYYSHVCKCTNWGTERYVTFLVCPRSEVSPGLQDKFPGPAAAAAASGTLLETQILRFLSCLPTNKIGYHSFVGAGRGHNTPGSETKNFIFHCVESIVNITFTLIPPVL